MTPSLRSSQGWTGTDLLPSSPTWMWQTSSQLQCLGLSTGPPHGMAAGISRAHSPRQSKSGSHKENHCYYSLFSERRVIISARFYSTASNLPYSHLRIWSSNHHVPLRQILSSKYLLSKTKNKKQSFCRKKPGLLRQECLLFQIPFQKWFENCSELPSMLPFICLLPGRP